MCDKQPTTISEKLLWLTECRHFFDNFDKFGKSDGGTETEIKFIFKRLKYYLNEEPYSYVQYEMRKVYVAALHHAQFQHVLEDITSDILGETCGSRRTEIFLEVCKEALSTRNSQCQHLLGQLKPYIIQICETVLSALYDDSLYTTLYNLLVVIYKISKIVDIYRSVTAVEIVEHVICSHHKKLVYLIFHGSSSKSVTSSPSVLSQTSSVISGGPPVVSTLATKESLHSSLPIPSSSTLITSLFSPKSTLVAASVAEQPPEATNSSHSETRTSLSPSAQPKPRYIPLPTPPSPQHVTLIRHKILTLFNRLYSRHIKDHSVSLSTSLLDAATDIVSQLQCVDLGTLMSSFTTGFTGVEVSTAQVFPTDMKQWTLLLLRMMYKLLSCSQTPTQDETVRQVVAICQTVDHFLVTKLDVARPFMFPWLPALFGDQDDMWIEAMLLLLEISLLKMSEFNSSMQFQHHCYFLQFVQNCGFDHSIFIDLLTSPETNFLVYLTRYLKYTLNTWSEFVSSHVMELEHEDQYSKTTKYDEPVVTDATVTYSPEYVIDATVNSAEISVVRDDSDHIVNGGAGICYHDLTSLTNSLCHTEYRIEETTTSSKQKADVDAGPSNAYTEGLVLLHDNYCSSESSDSDEDNYADEAYSELESDVFICSHDQIKVYDNAYVNDETDMDSINEQYSMSPSPSGRPSGSVDEAMEMTNGSLEETMAVLIRVRLKLEKLCANDILQYNPQPLLKLLHAVEDKYEN